MNELISTPSPTVLVEGSGEASCEIGVVGTYLRDGIGARNGIFEGSSPPFFIIIILFIKKSLIRPPSPPPPPSSGSVFRLSIGTGGYARASDGGDSAGAVKRGDSGVC